MQEQKPLPSLDQAILRVLNRHCHTEGQRHAERLRTLTLVDTRAEAEDEAGRARRVQAATSLLEVGRAAFARDMITKLVAPGAAPVFEALRG